MVRMTGEEGVVLSKIDGTRSMGDLVDLQLLPEVQCYALIYGLAILGFLATQRN